MALLPCCGSAHAASQDRRCMQCLEPAAAGTVLTSVQKGLCFCTCFGVNGQLLLVYAHPCMTGKAPMPILMLAEGLGLPAHEPWTPRKSYESTCDTVSSPLLWLTPHPHSLRPALMLTCCGTAGDWQPIAGNAGSGRGLQLPTCFLWGPDPAIL